MTHCECCRAAQRKIIALKTRIRKAKLKPKVGKWNWVPKSPIPQTTRGAIGFEFTRNSDFRWELYMEAGTYIKLNPVTRMTVESGTFTPTLNSYVMLATSPRRRSYILNRRAVQ